jgi:hypothetical protein
LEATLFGYKWEKPTKNKNGKGKIVGDDDYHLAIKDAGGRTMIAEIEETMSLIRERLISACLVIVLVVMGMAWAIVSAGAKKNGRAVKEVPAALQYSARGLATGPVQNVHFTLYDVGIYPREAQVEKGLVAISIEDQSGGSSGVMVERVEGSARVVQGRVNRLRNRFRARDELLLTPGRYEVHDAERPDNKALLIVEP